KGFSSASVNQHYARKLFTRRRPPHDKIRIGIPGKHFCWIPLVVHAFVQKGFYCSALVQPFYFRRITQRIKIPEQIVHEDQTLIDGWNVLSLSIDSILYV